MSAVVTASDLRPGDRVEDNRPSPWAQVVSISRTEGDDGSGDGTSDGHLIEWLLASGRTELTFYPIGHDTFTRL